MVFAADIGNVHIEKRYRVDPTRYRLQLDVVVANRGDAASRAPPDPVDRRPAGSREEGRRLLLGRVGQRRFGALLRSNDKIERKSIEKLDEGPDRQASGGRHAGSATDEKFFLLAAVPYPEAPRTSALRRAARHRRRGGDAVASPSAACRRKARSVYPFAIYAGPKVTDDLEAGPRAGRRSDGRTDTARQVRRRHVRGRCRGRSCALLKFFHGFAHNWGLAIVLLTLFIKLLTFYFDAEALISGKKMQKLQPKMAAIRKKFENDRQRQSVETMNLYKAHGVSPFGGCLPGLIQMPIWIALYSTLNYASELYRAPFFAHIHDLTAKDPYYVTPLLMGGVMYLQMKMSPAGTDPQQAAMMSVMMPLMFTGFSLFLPSGLAVYMLTSYLFGIVQQLYVNHLDRKGKITV